MALTQHSFQQKGRAERQAITKIKDYGPNDVLFSPEGTVR